MMQPDVKSADTKFSLRAAAFAVAIQHLPISVLTNRLAVPAAFGVPSLCVPAVHMSLGSFYRISSDQLACVMNTDVNSHCAYVVYLHREDPCGHVNHSGACWKYAKGSKASWVKIETLGKDAICIAPPVLQWKGSSGASLCNVFLCYCGSYFRKATELSTSCV